MKKILLAGLLILALTGCREAKAKETETIQIVSEEEQQEQTQKPVITYYTDDTSTVSQNVQGDHQVGEIETDGDTITKYTEEGQDIYDVNIISTGYAGEPIAYECCYKQYNKRAFMFKVLIKDSVMTIYGHENHDRKNFYKEKLKVKPETLGKIMSYVRLDDTESRVALTDLTIKLFLNTEGTLYGSEGKPYYCYEYEFWSSVVSDNKVTLSGNEIDDDDEDSDEDEDEDTADGDPAYKVKADGKTYECYLDEENKEITVTIGNDTYTENLSSSIYSRLQRALEKLYKENPNDPSIGYLAEDFARGKEVVASLGEEQYVVLMVWDTNMDGKVTYEEQGMIALNEIMPK